MLYRSGDNLEAGAIEFIESNESITLFSAYLKLDALKRINSSNNIKQIVVRWDIEDICRGISDIELYQYCLDEKIALYRNTRIHLKAIWNNNTEVMLGSANVTNKGLGEKSNYNFELNGKVSNISFEDRSYFNKLILESEYVTKELFDKLKKIKDTTELPTFNFPKLPTPPPTVDYFLINQLPMTSNPELLFEIYSGTPKAETEMNCASHDLELYQLPGGLDLDDFMKHLKHSFNLHPFIVKFKNAIKEAKDDKGRTDRDGSMRFGAVRQWFIENTTTVPVPRSFELTEYVEILYKWICEFDDCFTFSVPGKKSQVIRYNCQTTE